MRLRPVRMTILAPNEVAWLAANVGRWEHADVVTAVAVAYAESGHDTDAMNRRYPPNVDLGLFQLSTRWQYPHLVKYRWHDPYDNTRVARLVFDGFVARDGDGWQGWTAYRNGAHLPHMPLAELAAANPWEPVNRHTTAWRR